MHAKFEAWNTREKSNFGEETLREYTKTNFSLLDEKLRYFTRRKQKKINLSRSPATGLNPKNAIFIYLIKATSDLNKLIFPNKW